MSEQTYLGSIKLGEKNFGIFVNKYHRKSFLEILKDGSFCYPLAEDYIKLDEIYNKRKLEGIYLFKKVSFIPRFIEKANKVTVAALLATSQLFLTGCNSPVLTDFQKKQLEAQGIIVEDSNGIAIIIEKDGIIYAKNNDEFRKYVENQNPTFDDCRKSLENNNNFTEEYKNFFANYINSLEKAYPEFDLVFLHNFLEKGTVEIVPGEDIEERIEERIDGEDVAAYFNFLTNSIVATITDPNKASQEEIETLTHETVHASTTGCVKNDEGKTVVKTFETQNVETVKDAENSGVEYVVINYTGRGVLEAATDIITSTILGVPGITDGYIEEVDELKLLLKRLDSNITDTDILEGNVLDLIKELEKSGVGDPDSFIDCIDVSNSGNEDLESQNAIRWYFYIEYFKDLTQNMIDNKKSAEEIYRIVTEYLDKSHIQEWYNVTFYKQSDLYVDVLETVNKTLTLNGSSGVESPADIVDKYAEGTQKLSFLISQDEIKDMYFYVYLNEQGQTGASIGRAEVDEKGELHVYDADTKKEVEYEYGEYITELIKKRTAYFLKPNHLIVEIGNPEKTNIQAGQER